MDWKNCTAYYVLDKSPIGSTTTIFFSFGLLSDGGEELILAKGKSI